MVEKNEVFGKNMVELYVGQLKLGSNIDEGNNEQGFEWSHQTVRNPVLSSLRWKLLAGLLASIFPTTTVMKVTGEIL